MEVMDRNRVWKNLKQRLATRRGIGCCGAIFSSSTPTITILEALNLEDSDDQEDPHPRNSISVPFVSRAEDSGMNLAMALAAERNFHVISDVGTPRAGNVKTLMALIEETDGVDLKGSKRDKKTVAKGGGAGDSGGGGGDGVCCVCMERNKGAAFIPCGHTFCRACSRELWLNRGSCPICNRSISEILDIF